MIYVGIDVAKTTHYAAAADSDGVVLVEPFAFDNDAPGFAKFISKIASFPKEQLIIGLESTGIYSENLICFLFDSGYKLAVINPIQTATLRKTNIRKTKTDKVDTLLIIKSLIVNSYRLYTEQDTQSLKLKSLCRFRQSLKNPRQDSKFSFRDMSTCFSPNCFLFLNPAFTFPPAIRS